jgi:hypothetical protein
MSGNYANAAARRRRAGGASVPTNNQQEYGYADIRRQEQSMTHHSTTQYPQPPQGKIHIQQAFDILIQRVNHLEGEVQVLGNERNDDYSSHITLIFEKLNTIERRFNTLINDNEDSLNVENLKDNSLETTNEFTESNKNEDSIKTEAVFNFVKKEDLSMAVSNVVAKEEFNEIMTSVGKDIGDITERTMRLNELLLQVQSGNIMLNNAISTIRQEMKKRYVVVGKGASTDNVAEVNEEDSTDLKSMNKNEIAEEVKRELTNVAGEVDESDDDDGLEANDVAKSTE